MPPPPLSISPLNLPNTISAARVVLAPVLAVAVFAGRPGIALVIFAVVVLSDMLDGPLARRRGTPTPFGTLIDHGADACFVTIGTAVYAALGVLPWMLPVAIAIAFTQYVADASLFSSTTPRPSRLGRYNGIAYFVIVGAAIAADYDDRGAAAASALRAGAWLLVATTATSIALRAIAAWQARRGVRP